MRNAGVKKLADHVELHCVGLSLRKLNRVISGVFNSELAAVGVTHSQFNVLTAIAKMQPAAAAKVAKVLHLEKSSLSRNLELMRRNGWLRVEGEGRAMLVSMTGRGENVYERAFPCWERAQAMSQKILGAEVAKDLRTVLKSLQSS